MLGFKRFETAAVTVDEIERAAKIRKQQFKMGKLLGQAVDDSGHLDSRDRRIITILAIVRRNFAAPVKVCT